MLKEGWLDRQYRQALLDMQRWPEWMKREAGHTTPAVNQQIVESRVASPKEPVQVPIDSKSE